MNVQQRVNEIIARHCTWMAEQIEQLEKSCAPDKRADQLGCAELGQMRELVHQMNGSSGTVGFAEIGRAAARLEDHLVELMERQGSTISKADWSILTAQLDDLRQLISKARPEHSSLYRTGTA
ncbi:MAG: hypothetical protein HKN60_04260 [Rhizobiales bacterium]|nr:hypothetical protein [Hyphomicrobiales bacterium]